MQPDSHRAAALRLPLPTLAAGEPPLWRASRETQSGEGSQAPAQPGGDGGERRSGEPGGGGTGQGDSGSGTGQGGSDQGGSDQGGTGQGGTGQGGQSPDGPGSDGQDSDRQDSDRKDQPPQDDAPVWGSQWSRRQPPRRQGPWGSDGQDNAPQGGQGWGPPPPPPGSGGRQQGGGPWGQDGGQGPGRPPQGRSGPERGGPPQDQNGQQGPGGLRWDPTDPAQRRARYALVAGMWGFFFALFTQYYIGLLLGALALYWGISSLRARPGSGAGTEQGRQTDALGQPVPRGTGPAPARPQMTAAVTGIVTASLALMLVAGMLGVRLAYHDYFSCRADALTQVAKDNCDSKLPKPLRQLFGGG